MDSFEPADYGEVVVISIEPADHGKVVVDIIEPVDHGEIVMDNIEPAKNGEVVEDIIEPEAERFLRSSSFNNCDEVINNLITKVRSQGKEIMKLKTIVSELSTRPIPETPMEPLSGSTRQSEDDIVFLRNKVIQKLRRLAISNNGVTQASL